MKDNFIYVPSINLWVAKETKLNNKTWFEAHKNLQENGERMLIIPEFIEFLKHTKNNFPEIYKKITENETPGKEEWLDANFKLINGKFYINHNHLLKNGTLVPQNSEVLKKNLLIYTGTRRYPEPTIEGWINNPTKQGLPRKNTEKSHLNYRDSFIQNDANSRFFSDPYYVGLDCSWRPSYFADKSLGVRATKK
jgi:hypothetical protein